MLMAAILISSTNIMYLAKSAVARSNWEETPVTIDPVKKLVADLVQVKHNQLYSLQPSFDWQPLQRKQAFSVLKILLSLHLLAML